MSSAPYTNASADPELPQVFGRYLLVQRISRGGMGEIFLAKHGLSGFEKLCVIKKVLPDLVEDRHFISRFVDEAQVAIQLQHNNVAQVFEVGRVGDEYFLALEYVEGRDLRRILSVLRKRDRRLPLAMALFVVREVASGLSYAHRRTDAEGASLDLVHCDISPPNVVLSFEGEVKVIDFGIAKSALRVTATDPKIGFGKFGYMAPEQLVRGGVVDHRTDIYSTGVILYEVLTGRRLYKLGKNPDYRALARKVARGEYDLPSVHDRALAPFDPIVRRTLSPKPDQRYQSAAELRDDVQRALVAIDPTMSSEKLGAYLRELFAAELAEARNASAAASAFDLAPWQAQLTSQASDTVSFALADGRAATGGFGHAPAALPPPIRVSSGAHPAPGFGSGAHSAPGSGAYAVPGAHAASGSHPGISPASGLHGAAILTPRPRSRRAVIGGALALAAVCAGVVAVIAARGAGGERRAEAAQGDAVAADAGPVDAAQPHVTPLDAAATDSASAPVEPDAAPATKPRNDRRRRPPRGRDKPPERPDKPKSPELTREAVSAKFRSVSREYARFKQRYGKRLESQWADLASDAQFGGNSPEALRTLDAKIDRFRAAMRKAQ